MSDKYCPVCGQFAVMAAGDRASKVLIIGEFPGDAEMERGRPFVGPAGTVLRTELIYCGVDLNELRVMNLWIHPKAVPADRSQSKQIAEQNEKCLQVGYNLVLDEAKGKKAILLVGSDVVSRFTEYNVSRVAGLQVDSLFSCKNVWAMSNPAIVFQPGKGIGETRLALKKFTASLKKEKLL